MVASIVRSIGQQVDAILMSPQVRSLFRLDRLIFECTNAQAADILALMLKSWTLHIDVVWSPLTLDVLAELSLISEWLR